MILKVVMKMQNKKVKPLVATASEKRARDLVKDERKGNWSNPNNFAWIEEIPVDDKEALLEIIHSRGEDFVKGILKERDLKRQEYLY